MQFLLVSWMGLLGYEIQVIDPNLGAREAENFFLISSFYFVYQLSKITVSVILRRKFEEHRLPQKWRKKRNIWFSFFNFFALFISLSLFVSFFPSPESTLSRIKLKPSSTSIIKQAWMIHHALKVKLGLYNKGILSDLFAKLRFSPLSAAKKDSNYIISNVS